MKPLDKILGMLSDDGNGVGENEIGLTTGGVWLHFG